jgi:hypothetical protein
MNDEIKRLLQNYKQKEKNSIEEWNDMKNYKYRFVFEDGDTIQLETEESRIDHVLVEEMAKRIQDSKSVRIEMIFVFSVYLQKYVKKDLPPWAELFPCVDAK